MAIRRARKTLESAEWRVVSERHRLADIQTGSVGQGTLRNALEQVQFWEGEVDRLEALLEELVVESS